MMRKRIFLFVIAAGIVLLSACAAGKGENNEIPCKSGTYYNKNWSETVGTYTGAAIPDQETALEVAKAVFHGMDKSKDAQEYVPQSVFYDEEDEIWIVSFGADSDEIMLGGDCSIAIQKADGRVLRIWFGE